MLLTRAEFEGLFLPHDNPIFLAGLLLRYCLHTLYTTEAPAHMRLVPAVDVLRRSWIQQYWTDNGTVRWRTEADLPPNARLIVSPTTLAPALEGNEISAGRVTRCL